MWKLKENEIRMIHSPGIYFMLVLKHALCNFYRKNMLTYLLKLSSCDDSFQAVICRNETDNL